MTQFPAKVVERVALAMLNSHQRENEISERSELDAFDEPYRRDARVALEASGHAELVEALAAVEPHLDAIICYASTMGEHKPNRIAVQVRKALAKGRGEAMRPDTPSQDR